MTKRINSAAHVTTKMTLNWGQHIDDTDRFQIRLGARCISVVA